jgi:glutamate N-acetyltransferase/amino-acid N-acetyltransferase
MAGFFSSRWIDAPPNATEVQAGGLPAGFRAAGVASGIKAGEVKDLGLMVCDAAETTSAARFSRSGTLAAPVLVTKQRTKLGELRAIVVNSGNANAATGGRGMDDAAKMQGGAALVSGVREDLVAVASTGVIGVPLPMQAITRGTMAAARELRPDGDIDFAEAIRTTDAFAKRVTLDLELSQGPVRLSVQGKGAGMIAPGFATLLVFVQTDAKIDADELDLLLGVTCKRSFERVSVDGQMSTSDMVIMQASGLSGVVIEPKTDDERSFGEALDATLRQLALMVVRDGEGARRVGRVLVRGDERVVDRVARAVADSPLVKTALYGGDPNWGRIMQAVGAALPGTAPLAVDITIEGIQVAARGFKINFDEAALQAAVKRDEVEYEIGLPGEGGETERFFSDLGHEYVTINADYTT